MRTCVGMVSALDKSIGKVVKALKQKNMLANSIILFLSDNGGATTGPTENFASNAPFRGVTTINFSSFHILYTYAYLPEIFKY